MPSIWEQYTDDAKQTVLYAHNAAAQLDDNYVSTEHLLLGLVHGNDPSLWPPPPTIAETRTKRELDPVIASLLHRLNVSPQSICAALQKYVKKGSGRSERDMELTPRAKRALDIAYQESRRLRNNFIGTEHLLLGLIQEDKGIAAIVLSEMGITPDRVREEVAGLQGCEDGHQTPKQKVGWWNSLFSKKSDSSSGRE